MSTDAVAVLGFVVLFVLMLLRVPVGMAMGLVGVIGFGYDRRLAAGASRCRPDVDADVTDFNFARHPDVPSDGRVRHHVRHEPRTVPRRPTRSSAIGAAGSASRPSRRAAASPRSAAPRSRLPRPCPGCLSGDAALRLPAVVRHRRDCGGRHARHHDSALGRVRDLWPASPSRTSASCSSPASCRASRRYPCTSSRSLIGFLRPGFLPRASARPGPSAVGAARRVGNAGAVRFRDRRHVWRLVHGDRGGGNGRGRRVRDRRRCAAGCRPGDPASALLEATRTTAAIFTIADRRDPVRLLPHRSRRRRRTSRSS